MTLTTNKHYTQDCINSLKLSGWTGDATGCNVADWFTADGLYKGPDADGLEPIFEGYLADIDGGQGGDTIITADNEDEAMEKAMAWAAAGSWEPGNEYYVRLMDADGDVLRCEYVTA